MADRCIFCEEPFSDARPRSDEHAASRWCRKLMPDRGRAQHTFVVENERGRVELDRGYRDPFTTVAEDVCAPCNTGWSEELEDWAERWLSKPVQGERRVLRFWRQSLAAAWAVKTAIVWESVEMQHRTLPAAVGRTFHSIQRATLWQNVWVGRYLGDEPHVFHRMAAEIVGSRPEGAPDPEHPDAYLIIVGVGQLVFVVLGHGLLGPDRRPITIPPPEGFEDKLIEIWPLVHEVVEWPPPGALSDADLDAIAHSFGQPIRRPRAPE